MGQLDLHRVILARVQAGVQLSASNDGDGVTGLFEGDADRLHSAGELLRIEVVGEQVNVFGGPVHQTVGGQRVATGEGETVFLGGSQPYAGQLPVPWIHVWMAISRLPGQAPGTVAPRACGTAAAAPIAATPASVPRH